MISGIALTTSPITILQILLLLLLLIFFSRDVILIASIHLFCLNVWMHGVIAVISSISINVLVITIIIVITISVNATSNKIAC